MKKFIYTNNKESANKLKKLGFKLFKESSNGDCIFINNNNLKFENIKNVSYSDILIF